MRLKKDYNFSYKKSGIDVQKANKLIKKAKPLINSTSTSNTVGEIGGFGGLFKINPKNYKQPLLVAATDGVGTKLLIAEKLKKFDTLGVDLVAMSVNDIIVQGAKPLFFLDYLAINKLNEKIFLSILKGITKGCLEAGCSLIGGETAELPGIYPKGGFDLAGFCVGIVEKRKLLPNGKTKAGDLLIGLPSNGIHSNGFSLIRKIISEKKISLSKNIFSNYTLGSLLLKPTKIYVKSVLKILKSNIKVTAIAHITGGGLEDNLKRVIPNNLGFSINKNTLAFSKKNNIYFWLKNDCKIPEKELLKTFNCGIGMIIVIPKSEKNNLYKVCNLIKQPLVEVGEITSNKKNNFF
jgi:phosphoribosylformylglycinamidine cyclo-ligase